MQLLKWSPIQLLYLDWRHQQRECCKQGPPQTTETLSLLAFWPFWTNIHQHDRHVQLFIAYWSVVLCGEI